MTEAERQTMNDGVHSDLAARLTNVEQRLGKLEKHCSELDLQFAVINTKLSAILWGLGVTGTAVIGVLIKMLFGA